ncbi:amidohydrolase family protein [Caulobacter sp. SSI4214]|uniref:N-acyl-D-amino-acid deacylase family protein n=1 Tax=Caulobacter sp. SSI4214 TaxID=2575739 RepID=UPI00143C9543|nr:amidohydrolase family protein [Caulobacter sp. SSI4214]
MARFDTLIRNGFVIDGTGTPGVYADIGLKDGRVAAIGRLLEQDAADVIDASGMVVAPGHVTQHAHHDAQLFWDPYCANSGEHGVTTILNANCGFSIAPVRPQDRERTMLMLSTTEQVPVEQQRAGLPWNWETFPEYLDRVKALPKGVNIMSFLPLNPLLIYVMGIEGAKSRRPTTAEMAEMHRLINEAMDHGAAGISMSVMGYDGNSHLDYDGTAMPTDMLHDDDVVEIARAVAVRGEGLIQMLSAIFHFGNRGITEKVARMARGSGARVIHAAILTNDHLAGAAEADVAWLEGLRDEGLDISGSALLNRGWVEANIGELDTAAGQLSGVREIIACETDEDRVALLADPAFVARFSAEYAGSGPASGAGGLEGQIVIDVGEATALESWIGRTLVDIAAERGETVVQTLCDLGVQSKLKAQLKSDVWAANDPIQARNLLTSPAVASGVSDAGAHTKAFANGHYATELIIWLVRDQKVFTLEEMHHQLSFKVARTIGLSDRGAILPGFWADLLIYNLADLYQDRDRYEIVHDMPNGDWRRNARSGGYSRILVNGVTTYHDGKPTGALPGQFARVTQDMASSLPLAAE